MYKLIPHDHEFLLVRNNLVDLEPMETCPILKEECDEAYRIMSEKLGVGLALCQIGIDKSAFVMDADFFGSRFKKITNYADELAVQLPCGDWVSTVEHKLGHYIPFVNPWFEDGSTATSKAIEGCLSIPNKAFKVNRHKSIHAGWQSIDGEPHNTKLSGQLARVFQHEYDHTQGVLISTKGKEIKNGKL